MRIPLGGWWKRRPENRHKSDSASNIGRCEGALKKPRQGMIHPPEPSPQEIPSYQAFEAVATQFYRLARVISLTTAPYRALEIGSDDREIAPGIVKNLARRFVQRYTKVTPVAPGQPSGTAGCRFSWTNGCL